MLSKCANPTCTTRLHYLREGKVFKIESETNLLLVNGRSKKAPRSIEHFWLCGPCSETLTLVTEEGRGVQVVRKPLIRRAAAS
jgi:hypothetical protein